VSLWESYKMRLRRRRKLIRALRKSRELKTVQDHTPEIRPSDVLLVTTMRNESVRIPYFLRYYRSLGINHFLIIDNGSTDDTRQHFIGQRDVSL